MKRLFLFIFILTFLSCTKTNSLHSSISKNEVEQLTAEYNRIELKLYDEVKKANTYNIDFSDITSGLEKEYNNCNNEMLKQIIGYELAKNYYLNFRNSNDSFFIQNSEKHLYSFLSYRNGSLASEYLNFDPGKTEYLLKNWKEFNSVEKDSIMFYALLRGFEFGLPDILKNQP